MNTFTRLLPFLILAGCVAAAEPAPASPAPAPPPPVASPQPPPPQPARTEVVTETPRLRLHAVWGASAEGPWLTIEWRSRTDDKLLGQEPVAIDVDAGPGDAIQHPSWNGDTLRFAIGAGRDAYVCQLERAETNRRAMCVIGRSGPRART